MNKHFYLWPIFGLFAFFFLQKTVAQVIVPNPVDGIVWEKLGGVPTHATSFAKSRKRLFAGSNFGLFYSDDYGASWARNMFFGPSNIYYTVATDSSVMVALLDDGDPMVVTDDKIAVWCSLDLGQTFTQVLAVPNGHISHGSRRNSRLISKNQTVWVYTEGSLSAGLYINLRFSTDKGMTWKTVPYDPGTTFLGSPQVYKDTVFVPWAPTNNPVSAGYILRRQYTKDDFSGFELDTIWNNLLLHANGLDFGFDIIKNKMWSSNDHGLSIVEDTLTISAGNFGSVEIIGNEIFISAKQLYTRKAVAIDKERLIFDNPLLWFVGQPIPVLRFGKRLFVSGANGIEMSGNNGKNWQPRSKGFYVPPKMAQKFGDHWFLKAETGAFRSDTDLNNPELIHFSSAQTVELNGVLFLTAPNEVLRSLNGGKNWISSLKTPGTGTYRNLQVAGNRLYLFGYNELLRTDDLGKNWTNIPLPQNQVSGGSKFFPMGDTLAILRNAQPHLLVSSDGGITWAAKATWEETGLELPPVFMSNGRFFRLSGTVIQSTQIGENNWSGPSVSPSLSIPLISGANYVGPPTACFSNEHFSLVATGQTGLWATKDGGATWNDLQTLPFKIHGKGLYTFQILIACQIEDGFLYIFGADGTWRTPLTELLSKLAAKPDAPPSILLQKETANSIHQEVDIRESVFEKKQIILDLDDDFGLEIFPNPASGDVQIAVNPLQSGGQEPVSSIFSIKITDAAGRLLISEKAALPKKLDLGGLPGGVYWLTVSDGERVVVRKIVRI